MNQMEIARKLKVSQTTVSMVLNNPSTTKVSQEKRRKIMDLMRSSSYLLRAHNGKTWNIGYVLEPGIDINSSFYSRFFAGIQNESAKAGYNVIMDNENINNSRLITQNKVDGIILEDKLKADQVKDISLKIPLVLLNYSTPETLCDTVIPDNSGGIIKALNHLTELGHSRIAFLGALPPGGKIDGNLRERRNYFESEAFTRNLLLTKDFIKIPILKTVSIEATEKAFSEILGAWMQMPQPPTAVICGNDLYAAILLRIAAGRNIKVPAQLSIIGTDNTSECEYTYPPLTSIDHNAPEMGRLAIELLLKRISSPDRALIKISCDSKIVTRKSTGPLNLE